MRVISDDQAWRALNILNARTGMVFPDGLEMVKEMLQDGSTVTAKIARSGSWWAVRVPEIPGLFTQVGTLDLVQKAVVEAASLLGVTLDESDVVVISGGYHD